MQKHKLSNCFFKYIKSHNVTKKTMTDKPFNKPSFKSKEISKQVQTSWNANTKTLLSLVNTDLVFGSAGTRKAKTCHSRDGWDRTESHGCCLPVAGLPLLPLKMAQILIYTRYQIPDLIFNSND